MTFEHPKVKTVSKKENGKSGMEKERYILMMTGALGVMLD